MVDLVQPSGNTGSSFIYLDILHPCRLWPSSVSCLIQMTGFKGSVCTRECFSDGCLATMAIRSPKTSPSSPPSSIIFLSVMRHHTPPVTLFVLFTVFRSVSLTRWHVCHGSRQAMMALLAPYIYFFITVVLSLAGLVYFAMYTHFHWHCFPM